MTDSTELIEIGAEALWQAERIRAQGKKRSVSWVDGVNEEDKESYRKTVAHQFSAINAAGWAVVPDYLEDSRYVAAFRAGYSAGQEGDEKRLQRVTEGRGSIRTMRRPLPASPAGRETLCELPDARTLPELATSLVAHNDMLRSVHAVLNRPLSTTDWSTFLEVVSAALASGHSTSNLARILVDGDNTALKEIREPLSAAAAGRETTNSTEVRSVEPHKYRPDPNPQMMGDCAICGHVQDASIHTARRETE